MYGNNYYKVLLENFKPKSSEASKSNHQFIGNMEEKKGQEKWHNGETAGQIQNVGNSTEQMTHSLPF